MHVLVIGNTGFIGTQLSKVLINKGYDVTLLSRNQRDSQLSLNDSDPNYQKKTIKCDILQQEHLQEVFKKIATVDCVFHLAGQTYNKNLSSPEIYFQNNLIGTLNVLECCKNFNVKKLIYSSSIAVYGLGANQSVPNYLPVDEKHSVKPYDFYDLSKLQAEELCKFYSERFDIKTVILRYSRVFGPQLNKGLIFNAIKKAIANEPIEIYGDVSTDFVYIDDVVNANLNSAEKKLPNFETFNIGSGEETTLYWICSKIIELCNSSSEIIMHSEPKSKFSLDISKAVKMLDYNPKKVKEGLIECIQYIKNST